MRSSFMLGFVALLAATSDATAADRHWSEDDYRPQSPRRFKALHRAYELMQPRDNLPLRAENLSDDEVREIERLVDDVLSPVLVNISAVTHGCPCEEGILCTD